MRRALPLSIQLLLTFVGLLVGLAVVLTTAAHKTLRTNLEDDAIRHVSLATRSREQTLTQLFQLRQQRAEGFLATRRVVLWRADRFAAGRLGRHLLRADG